MNTIPSRMLEQRMKELDSEASLKNLWNTLTAFGFFEHSYGKGQGVTWDFGKNFKMNLWSLSFHGSDK